MSILLRVGIPAAASAGIFVFLYYYSRRLITLQEEIAKEIKSGMTPEEEERRQKRARMFVNAIKENSKSDRPIWDIKWPSEINKKD